MEKKKKDIVIELYKKYGSKRKVAQELNVTRQYVIQVIKESNMPKLPKGNGKTLRKTNPPR